MDADPCPRRSSDRAVGLAVFLGCLLVYHLNGKPQCEVDCVIAPFAAWSIAQHGSFDLRPHSERLSRYSDNEIKVVRDGSWIPFRPPGAALATLPFVAPLAWVLSEPPGDLAMMQLGKLAASIQVALSAVVFFFLVRRLAPGAAVPATILYALGTSAWSVASQAIWAHGPAMLGVVTGLSLLLPAAGQRLRAHGAAWAGLALGWAVLARPTTIFFVLGSLLALVLARRWRPTIAFALAAGVPIGALFLYQGHYFGDPIHGGYGSESWSDRAPMWLSLSGLLLAPSRGLLVYSPALLLALPGLAVVWRTGLWTCRLLGCWLGAFLATLLCYARWPCWWAGWSFGPRFFCETMPFLCLLVALALAACRHTWQRRLASGLIGLSILVHALGVFGHSAHGEWHKRHEGSVYGLGMFTLGDSQIESCGRDIAGKLLGSLAARRGGASHRRGLSANEN
jgi:hypothetical protein